MRTLDLVYFNAGGGHRAAALALQAVLREQQRPVQVRLVDLPKVLDPGDRFRRLTGFAPEAFYNRRLASGVTLGLAQELKLLQASIRVLHEPMVRRLAAHWRLTRPDAVVSLVPNFNRAMHAGLARALPGVPYVTVLTDMADHPPHFWIEPDLDLHLIVGTPHAAAQALAAGCPAERVRLVSGMILRPEFHRPRPLDVARERVAQGLDPARPVGVVTFGGHGSRAMVSIARRLPDTPLILLCGHNAALAEQLRAQPGRAPRVVVEFTADVQRWMRLGDFLIGKPGPGSISEAVQCGLPVIVTRNRATMPQERYNTDWVLERGVGVVLERFRGVGAAVDEVVTRLPELRAAVARVHNRAVFEVADLLLEIAAHGRPAAAPGPPAGLSRRPTPAATGCAAPGPPASAAAPSVPGRA